MSAAAAAAAAERRKKKKTRKKRGLEFDNKAKNLWVYVTGLPSDITEEEVRGLLGGVRAGETCVRSWC